MNLDKPHFSSPYDTYDTQTTFLNPIDNPPALTRDESQIQLGTQGTFTFSSFQSTVLTQQSFEGKKQVFSFSFSNNITVYLTSSGKNRQTTYHYIDYVAPVVS